MKRLSPRLSPFGRRVRLVRAWRGLAVGLSLGGVSASGWAACDWIGWATTDWRRLAMLIGGSALAGAICGYAWPIAEALLTKSVDRRANLDDRLATAAERSVGDGPFDAALQADTDAHLKLVKASTVYPIRFGRWQATGISAGLLAAAIFLLGNSPILLSSDARRAREEMKKEGDKVERITRENFESPQARQEMSEAEKRLADEMRKYRQDLEKAHMSDEEALQRANDLSKQAESLMQKSAKDAQQSLSDAQHALDQMAKDQLTQAGFPDVDPSTAEMSDQDLSNQTSDAQQRVDQAQHQADGLQNQLDSLMKALANPKLSDAERKALEAQKKSLEKKLSDARDTLAKAQKDLAALKASKEVQELMKRIRANPLFKQLQALAKEMEKSMKAGSDGDRPPITEEERREMQRKLDALVKQLKDQKALEEYLKKLIEAMKHCNGAGRCKGLCLGLNALVPIPGTGAPGNSIMVNDIGKVNHSSKALPSEGKTQDTMITGASRPSTEDTPYIEIKAPTQVGTRSAVPYTKVLPSYRKKAESAMDRQEIPKEDEKRVRAYFESLGH